MEQQCASLGCINPASILKTYTADISMSSTSSRSVRTEKICLVCAAQDKRMAEFDARAVLNQ